MATKSTAKKSSRRGSRKSSNKRYGEKASQKVERAMHEMKRGELRSGRSRVKVKSRRQAIAIGLSEARRAGGKVPSVRRRSSGSRNRSSSAARSSRTRRRSPKH